MPTRNHQPLASVPTLVDFDGPTLTDPTLTDWRSTTLRGNDWDDDTEATESRPIAFVPTEPPPVWAALPAKWWPV